MLVFGEAVATPTVVRRQTIMEGQNMSEEVNKEQTKGAEQESSTELTDEQLADAPGGGEPTLYEYDWEGEGTVKKRPEPTTESEPIDEKLDLTIGKREK